MGYQWDQSMLPPHFPLAPIVATFIVEAWISSAA